MYKVYLENKTDSGGHNYNLFKNMPLYLVSVAKKSFCSECNCQISYKLYCSHLWWIYANILKMAKYQNIKVNISSNLIIMYLEIIPTNIKQ